jgi:hypothetical protein
MDKITLEEISVEVTRVARDTDEVTLHVKVSTNSNVAQKHVFIPLNDLESLYDTVWDYTGEQLKRLILAETKK